MEAVLIIQAVMLLLELAVLAGVIAVYRHMMKRD